MTSTPIAVCALIPAFNEAPTVGTVVTGARRHVPDVLVVDDGSTDTTAETAAGAGARVVRHLQNRGKGCAVRTGLKRVLAGPYSHVLLMDADLQHDPNDIPVLLSTASTGIGDLVIGERQFNRAQMPRSRFYTNTISSRVISRFFIGAEVSDTQSGFRLIRTSALSPLRLTGRGYEIETEMLIKLTREGVGPECVPVAAPL